MRGEFSICDVVFFGPTYPPPAQPPDGGRAWISLMSVLRFFGSRVSLAGKRVFREKQRSVFFPKSKEVKKP